ncbi:NAD-dependent epimerase/dehydratase family protein [Microbacterium sp. X-17]|uniref:NAD-dependent epimerase/dehydratase family protein n=1 Tax=Microbacterium sp. X-17 TaxID=3144404 RepID=UPI0031F4E803
MNTPASHVVLGGNGVIGRETLRALRDRGLDPVSVTRTASAAGGIPSVLADLTVASEARTALSGAGTAYLVLGLPYTSRAWEEQWPVIARTVADAAVENGTHLVFLDNVYAYGRVEGVMTERTPIAPASRKGRARAAVLAELDSARGRGLVCTIGRSADFYGPGARTSAFNRFVIDRVAAGREGVWLFDAGQPHSLTYTPDIGDALAVLGTDPRARGGVWHLPTGPALTGREYVALAAGPDARCRTMSTFTMRVGALFTGEARETLEMAYQYTAPYVLDASAFTDAFGMTATPYADGIAASLAAARA